MANHDLDGLLSALEKGGEQSIGQNLKSGRVKIEAAGETYELSEKTARALGIALSRQWGEDDVTVITLLGLTGGEPTEAERKVYV